MVFVRRIPAHPGMRAQPFLKPAIANGRKFLRQLGAKQFAKYVNQGMSYKEAAGQVMFVTATIVQVAAQKLAPVDTGRLKNSIYFTGRGEFKYVIGTNVVYAIYIEKGTGKFGPYHKTYEIVPKTPGGVLAFKGTRSSKGKRTLKSGKGSRKSGRK